LLGQNCYNHNGLSFNMGWRILVFYLEPVSMIYLDSDMSKTTNTVVYFDWKTAIYIYVYGQCRTQFMLSYSSNMYIYDGKPAHVLMRLYPIDKSLVCLQTESRTLC
jgi:hypothetical protein